MFACGGVRKGYRAQECMPLECRKVSSQRRILSVTLCTKFPQAPCLGSLFWRTTRNRPITVTSSIAMNFTPFNQPNFIQRNICHKTRQRTILSIVSHRLFPKSATLAWLMRYSVHPLLPFFAGENYRGKEENKTEGKNFRA